MNDTITKIVALLFEDLEETEETAALHDEISAKLSGALRRPDGGRHDG